MNTTNGGHTNQATADLEKLVPSSLSEFAVSFGINAAIAVGLLLVFCLLRIKYKTFSPRLTQCSNQKIPRLSASPFRWIHQLACITDDQLLAAAGLDALILIRAYKFGIKLFLCLSIYAFAVILPINYTAENGMKDYDQLTMANIPQRSSRLWAHFLGVYLFTGVTLSLLNSEYKEFVALRLHYNQQRTPNAYTVLVKGIPGKEADNENLGKLFDFLQRGDVHSAVALQDVSRLDRDFAKCEEFCHQLEHVLYIHDRDPNGVRPSHRTGFLGLCGPRVDSIDYYERKLEEYNQKVRAGQISPHPSSGNGFVTFASLAGTATSVQVLIGENTEKYVTRMAPEPCDVYWPNLSLSEHIKLVRRTIVGVITFLLIFFYMIPVTFVQSLTSMETLSKRIPGFGAVVDASPIIRGFLQGFLPTLALKIFFAILPMICSWLGTFEGNEATSLIERSQLAKLFYFQVFNIFLGSLLTGSVLQQISNIIDDPKSVTKLLGRALPTKATFFTSYVMLLSTGMSLDLLRVGPTIMSLLKASFFAKTPKERAEARLPNPSMFGVLLPEILLVLCIGLTYSLIAPLCLAFCVLYMVYGYIVHKYLVLYVDHNLYQSGGMFFPPLFNRTVVALLIMQLTMIGLLGLKVSPLAIPAAAAPIVTLFAYSFMCKWYGPPSQSMPLLLARSLDEGVDTMTGDGGRETIDPQAYWKPCLKAPPAVPDRWDEHDCLLPPASASATLWECVEEMSAATNQCEVTGSESTVSETTVTFKVQ